MNAKISEKLKAKILGLGMQILGLSAHRKFVSERCQAHGNAQKRQ